MQNLQGIGNFFHGFQSRPLDPKDFCMEATGTPRQSVGFPGAKNIVTILILSMKYSEIKKSKRRGFIHGTVYPKKYAHDFCFAVLCCGYTMTDFPISSRLTSLALWQSYDCPSASKATLMNMDKYFMWIHYERLHNHNEATHNKTVCIFLGIYCMTIMDKREVQIDLHKRAPVFHEEECPIPEPYQSC